MKHINDLAQYDRTLEQKDQLLSSLKQKINMLEMQLKNAATAYNNLSQQRQRAAMLPKPQPQSQPNPYIPQQPRYSVQQPVNLRGDLEGYTTHYPNVYKPSVMPPAPQYHSPVQPQQPQPQPQLQPQPQQQPQYMNPMNGNYGYMNFDYNKYKR